MTKPRSEKEPQRSGPQRKKFELPGQTHEPPEESEPLRIFYESLHRQRPESEMAQIWMMEHGLLDEESAQRTLQLKQRRSKGGAVSPLKPLPPLKKGSPGSGGGKRKGAKGEAEPLDLMPLGSKGGSSVKKPIKGKAKKREFEEEDSEDEKPLTKIRKR